MAQFQIYKPNAPGGSRELQKDLFTGSEADIQKRKAAGEDISYSLVGAPDAKGAAPQPPAAPSAGPDPMASLGGGAAPPSAGAASPSAAMASLMEQQPPDPTGDLSLSGPSGLRQGMGTRYPPQYNYALASLGRGVY